MLIAIANAKGGVAKTTTSIYLGSAATVHGDKALVLDADSQDSASTWADAAEEEGKPLPFEVVAAKLSTIAKAKRQDEQDRGVWRFIDCPPSGMMLDRAIEAADFTIIPTSESSLDLTQAWQTYYAIRDSVPAAVLIVKAELNTTMHRDILEALDKADTPRFESIVRKRQDIVKSNGHNPRKLYEYADVYTELRKELGL
ncbi:ParA family protein [Bifidobacterium crudilactis]|uniref:ParA family protein n=1 Tax=Bifidobacterium crudilactis TaxID=327277 RepID=UPI00264941A6|nr:ParA family protein [Bifidobacterium crudilactis]MDN5973517.1 ParA family protein [Bifidobacterium crudilactis]MDN6001718.1 ParA family protein [Bifidobacterium crudilactis]MDN6210312.1 ParA family protein [Bifidobacterium crudilactis]MDN6468298.1 ParA family protein [Bifidobacterium crudilactis]MDN6773407.1 ParA family protein [Bifidobacterium crudilactis]